MPGSRNLEINMSMKLPFDIEAIRAEFPILNRRIGEHSLVFLDSAASSQKPRAVIQAVTDLYEKSYANIHRGVYTLSAETSALYEGTRDTVQRFIGAADRREIIFVRNATEAINLVSRTWAEENLSRGDEVVITALEHHANIVPWQLLGQRKGTKLRVAPIDERGDVILDEFEALLNARTKLVSIGHVSNALGTVNPLDELISISKERGITVLVDGAQAVPHMPVDVTALGCDFYAFSGHKILAPSGIGVLYGRLPLLDAMPPFMGGGDMIESVSFEKTSYAPTPHKFEAGTPNIEGTVGLAAAIRFLEAIGMDKIQSWENQLLDYATERLLSIDGLRILGDAKEKAAVISFLFEDIHPHDIGTALDQSGVSVRVGHHCAQPLMETLGVPATIRASFSLYNTFEDIDRLEAAIRQSLELFR